VRRLRIDREMSRRLGDCGLSRGAVIRLHVRLRADLEDLYQLYRSLRHPQDQRLFRYLLSVADGDLMHRFFFVIDDSTSPDDLFIVDFQHECNSP
jgi:hypothetical protein